MDAAHHVRPRQREEVVVPLEGQRWFAKRSPRKSASSRRWPLIIVPVAPSRTRILSDSRRSRCRGRRRSRRPSCAPRAVSPPAGPPEEVARDQRTGQDAGQHQRHRRVPDGLVVERHGDDPEDRRQQADRDQPDGLLRVGVRRRAQPISARSPQRGSSRGPRCARRGRTRSRSPPAGRPAGRRWPRGRRPRTRSTSRRLMVGAPGPPAEPGR